MKEVKNILDPFSIQSEVLVKEVITYSIYGKEFETQELAEKYKKELDHTLQAVYFKVKFDKDTEGNYSGEFIFAVYDYLGEAGVISKLQAMGYPLLYSDKNGELHKNVEISKPSTFENIESLAEYLNGKTPIKVVANHKERRVV